MNWFVVLWTFFFGACLGSFLNVVAYRIPNQLTLLGSSRCPFCFVPIQSKHNVPIIGWFSLRGRCAACRLPIASRYFIVEIIAGLLLVWLFRFELYSDGQNLPTDRAFEIGRFFRVLSAGEYSELLQLNWGLIRNFFVHCLIAYAILTAALMKWDSFHIPRVWASVHLFIVAATILIWQTDFEFAGTLTEAMKGQSDFICRLDVPVVGGATGVVLGLLLSTLSRDRRSGLMFGFAIAGICLGFFGTVSLAAIFVWLAAAILLPSRIVQTADSGMDSRNLLLALLVAFLVQVGFWRSFDQNQFWPSSTSSIWVTIGYLFFLMLMTWVLSPKGNAVFCDPNSTSEESVAAEIRRGDAGRGTQDETLRFTAITEKVEEDTEN
jgi:leader peptidase (prepilin peptidase)/N-methyltransferase